ncbi:TadE/TadG family type IV pilus assembly protein [Stakelama saccharophila]|uniref:TadE/TadG family type IV pilus assembly protein n=1 Tax=Stakelama saccharophila TaxID=3075605 RepID=A0ABZ0BCG6_9SPHN|nr:TadE/TadG family type IV pilus assembly protein [Stakelama sp. W311]WNO55048.1 TadE/TadG family type IV pilus assembly protein [Stakelama sp. W311]
MMYRACRNRLNAVLLATKGVAMIEFALGLPLLLGLSLSGLEMGNYIIANNRVQRLASMAADLIAQSGQGRIGLNEGQIYDLFNALDVTAKPFNLREHGRIVITAVRGVDKSGSGKTTNEILWQRFDGAFAQAQPVLGCWQDSKTADLNKVLPKNELLFHVQVTYDYQPLFSSIPFSMLDLPQHFTRTAMYRARKNDLTLPDQQDQFPPKQNCDSADGL